jgi:hypothetical protein
MPDLDDEDCGAMKLPQLDEFLELLPPLMVHKDNVSDIPHETFEEVNERYQTELKKLIEDKEAMMRQIEQDRLDFEERLRSQKAEEERRHQREMDLIEKNFELQKQSAANAHQAALDYEKKLSAEREKHHQTQLQMARQEAGRKKGGCFDATNNVVVLRNGKKETIKLVDLNVGDFVQTVNGNGDIKFSKVFYEAHFDVKVAELLKIHFNDPVEKTEKYIGISDRHLIYSGKDSDAAPTWPILAGYVKEGCIIFIGID